MIKVINSILIEVSVVGVQGCNLLILNIVTFLIFFLLFSLSNSIVGSCSLFRSTM